MNKKVDITFLKTFFTDIENPYIYSIFFLLCDFTTIPFLEKPNATLHPDNIAKKKCYKYYRAFEELKC